MAETILGIDVRPGRIRMVRLASTFKKRTPLGFFEIEPGAGASLAEAAAMAAALVNESSFAGDTVVVGIEGRFALYRRMRFPFSSLAKIRQVFRFELENDLPRPAEEFSLAMCPGPREEGGSRLVMAAGLAREQAAEATLAFAEAGLKADYLDVAAGALMALAWEQAGEAEDASVYLDLGVEASTVLVAHRGAPVMVRGLDLGLETLASDMARRLEAAPEDILARLAAPGTDPDPDLSRALAEALGPLERQLMLSLSSLGAGEDVPEPSRLCLSGPGAQVPGLAEELGRRLELEVVAATSLGPSPESKDAAPLPPAFGTALGLALRGARPDAGFDFSREDAMRRFDIDWRAHLPYLVGAACVVFLAWLGATLFEIHTATNRLEQLDAKMQAVFEEALPGEAQQYPVTDYPEVLMARIRALNQSSLLSGPEAVRNSVVEILRKVSQAVPPNLKMDIDRFNLDERSIRIDAGADNFNAVEQIKNRLAAVPDFTDVKIQGAKADKDGKGVNFGLIITRRNLDLGGEA